MISNTVSTTNNDRLMHMSVETTQTSQVWRSNNNNNNNNNNKTWGVKLKKKITHNNYYYSNINECMNERTDDE